MGLFGKLFPPKVPSRPPRQLLAEVLADIGAGASTTHALRLFDEPEFFLVTMDGEGYPPDDDGEPWSEAQRARMIFEFILRDTGRLRYIDWSTGPLGIADEFDRLFATYGAAPLEERTRQRFMAKTNDGNARGESILILWDALGEEAESRGLHLHWWESQQDAHFPLLLRPEVQARWSTAHFGEGVDVLP